MNRNNFYFLLFSLFIFIQIGVNNARTSSPSPSPSTSPFPKLVDCAVLAGGNFLQSTTETQKFSFIAYNATSKTIINPQKSDNFIPKGVYSNGYIDNFISTELNNLFFSGHFAKVEKQYSNTIGIASIEKINNNSNNQTVIRGANKGIWFTGYSVPITDSQFWPSLLFAQWSDSKIVVAGSFSTVESVGTINNLALYDETTDTWSAFPNSNQLCTSCDIISIASDLNNKKLYVTTMSSLTTFATDLYSFSQISSSWHKFPTFIPNNIDQNQILRIAANSLIVSDDGSSIFAIGYSSSIDNPSIFDEVLSFYVIIWNASDSTFYPNIIAIWDKNCTSEEENLKTYPKITSILKSSNAVIAIPYSQCSSQMIEFKEYYFDPNFYNTTKDESYNYNEEGEDEGEDEDEEGEAFCVPLNSLSSIQYFLSTNNENEYFISDKQTIYHYFEGHWVILNYGIDQLGYSENEFEITALNYNNEYSRLYISIHYLANNLTTVLFWPYHNFENLFFSGGLYQPALIQSMITISNSSQIMIAGNFQYIDQVKCNSIALWNGTHWIDKGISSNRQVNAISELDGVVYAIAFDPMNDNYQYGSSLPIYYLDNLSTGKWSLLPNTPIISLQEGESSFSMSNTKSLYSYSANHSLFIGGDFYVILPNGDVAKGVVIYSSDTKQWSSLNVKFDQVNAFSIVDGQILEIAGKFNVIIQSNLNTNIAAYNFIEKKWLTMTTSYSSEIRAIAQYKQLDSIVGGDFPQYSSSIQYYDFQYNRWTTAPSLPAFTNSLSSINEINYAGGSYGLVKLDRNGSKWSYLTSQLYTGNIYSTLIICNATTYNNSTQLNGSSEYYTSIYEIDCSQYPDDPNCSSVGGDSVSVLGIIGLIIAVLFTVVVVVVVGVLFYIQKTKKTPEVEFI